MEMNPDEATAVPCAKRIGLNKGIYNFMLNTDFEKAMDNLSKDAVFKETVERRTDKFISRYGAALSSKT